MGPWRNRIARGKDSHFFRLCNMPDRISAQAAARERTVAMSQPLRCGFGRDGGTRATAAIARHPPIRRRERSTRKGNRAAEAGQRPAGAGITARKRRREAGASLGDKKNGRTVGYWD